MKHYVLYDSGLLTHAESCIDLEEANEIAEIYRDEKYANVQILDEVEFKKFNEQFTRI